MFYSHEVLTSRKYGVATVWLVATLGSKSGLKKVNRKAILEVNVPKACESILAPEAPLALRLQGNLLYGLSKVYSQQCTYILADAQTAQNNVRATLRILRAAELDPEAGRARPDQLLLQDDPTFLPDFALLPLDLGDLLNLEVLSSQRSATPSSRRSRSPRRSITLEEQTGGLIGGINLPSSDNSGFGDMGGFVVPGDEGSDKADLGGGAIGTDDGGFEPGVDFGFDAEGNLIEHDTTVQVPRTPIQAANHRVLSDAAASAQARQEHEEAHGAARAAGEEMDVDLPLGDDYDFLPEGEALPAAQVQRSQSARHETKEEVTESSSAVEAPLRRKRRALPVDRTMEIRTTELAGWMHNYIDNMREAGQQKHQIQMRAQAKKNAEHWVLGLGLGGVGALVGGSGLAGPLDMFRGEALLLSLGIDRSLAKKKRGRSDIEEAETDENDRRVRQRSEEDQVGRDDDIMEEDGMVPPVEDDIELPREAESEMGTRLSQTLPWNITASVRDSSLAPSARRALGFSGAGVPSSAGGPSSFGGVAGSLGPRGNRMVSASPLQDRGPPGGHEPLHSVEGSEGDDELTGGDLSMGDEEEFERYGAAAAVDTQTANESQFARTEFAKEMENFGLFIFDSLKAKEESAAAEGVEVEGINEVLFEDALPPVTTTRIVAAQGFMHLLSLATHSRVAVRQDEPFAKIGMSLSLAGSI